MIVPAKNAQFSPEQKAEVTHRHQIHLFTRKLLVLLQVNNEVPVSFDPVLCGVVFVLRGNITR